MANKILVIGATGKYSNADICPWRQIESQMPLIGDYANVIIYMPSLSQESFDPSAKIVPALRTIKKKATDALNGSTNIYYAVSPPVYFTASRNSIEIFPFTIGLDVEAGRNFKQKESAALPYLNKIESWQVAFRDDPSNFDTIGLNPTFSSLARTNHEKNAAFRIRFQSAQTSKPTGSVTILPPIMDNSEPSETKTIQELIDHLLPHKNEVFMLPDEFAKIALPGEVTLRNEDEALEKAILEAKNRKANIAIELDEYNLLKGIIATNGKQLEICVDVAFQKLSISYKPTNTNKEDGILEISDKLAIPVEIKGHETSGASEANLRQVITRLDSQTSNEHIRGVLIVNSFFKLSENERAKKKCFESSVIEQAKVFNIALVDTRILLNYIEDQLKTGANNLLEVLSTSTGELKYEPPAEQQNASTN